MGTVVVKGMKDLLKKMENLPREIERKVAKDAMTAAAQPMLHDARANAPVLTGLLVSTLKVTVRKNKRGFSARIQTEHGDYSGDEYYASFNEYGSIHQPAKPFMRPAFDRNVTKAIDIIISSLTAGIAAATKP